MSDQPREPQGQRPPINFVRGLVRTVVIATCVLLLIGAVSLMSRYKANRRLMTLAKPANPKNIDATFGWSGPTFDWLDRRIGRWHAMALLCRPMSLIVHGREESISNATILSMLRESAGMKAVFIHNRDLPAGCLEAIATRHPVEVLHIRLPVISGQDAGWLSHMTRLKQLNVDQFVREPRENDWSWLSSLPKLESLGVTMWGAADRDVIAIAECPASKNLSLSGELLTDEAVSRLCDLPALEFLTLEGRQLRLRFPNGRHFPSTLQTLDLNWTAVDDNSLATIAELPQLNRVSIMGGSVTDAGMETLARLPALRHLWLYELKQLTNDGMKALTASTSLHEVNVERCGTTSKGLLHLMAIPNWKDIEFENVRFHRDPGTAPPMVSSDTVEEFLSMRRRIQEEQDSVHNGPMR